MVDLEMAASDIWQAVMPTLVPREDVLRARRVDYGLDNQGNPMLPDVLDVGGWWDGRHLKMGAFHLWIDTSGRLRVKNGAPTSPTDGTIVGTQS